MARWKSEGSDAKAEDEDKEEEADDGARSPGSMPGVLGHFPAIKGFNAIDSHNQSSAKIKSLIHLERGTQTPWPR